MRIPSMLVVLASIAAASGSFGQLIDRPNATISGQDQAPQISEYVRKVFQDRNGHFWFGTNHEGVCRYDGTSLTYFSVREGFSGTAVRGIVQDKAGAMWFATEDGVSRYEGGKFTNYKIGANANDSDVWSMMLDKSGTLWVGTLTGVRRFDGTSFVAFPMPRVTVENPQSRFSPLVVFSMAEDHAGNLWFGTDGEGVHTYDGTSFTSYTTKEGLGGNVVRSVYADRRGRVWAGTDGGGVSCFEGAAIRTLSAKDGLNNNRVFGVLEDRAGNMWFSTLGAGACRYDGKTFTPFREESGLTRSHVQSMHEARDGTLWFGCSGGLFRFDGKSFINVTRNGPWQEKAQEARTIGPMASFAGMVSGQWKRTFSSGSSMIDTWYWGPGERSMRVMTEGQSGDGQPWREVRVFYWHSGLKQVCGLGISPFARGVSKGTITFDGHRADGVFNLEQFGFDPQKNGGKRKMGLRWIFDGPDMYRDTLLEDTGKGFETLAEWDHVRIRTPIPMQPRTIEAEGPKSSRHLKALEPLLGRTWESVGKQLEHGEAGGEDSRFQTTFEWVPYADAIYVRTVVLTKGGDPTHLLDAYFYHHTGANALRCLALTKSGGVYEGDVTVHDVAEHAGGSLQLDLKGYEGDRSVPTVASFDFEKDGTVRKRIWSVVGTERTLMLDARHRRLEPKKD